LAVKVGRIDVVNKAFVDSIAPKKMKKHEGPKQIRPAYHKRGISVHNEVSSGGGGGARPAKTGQLRPSPNQQTTAPKQQKQPEEKPQVWVRATDDYKGNEGELSFKAGDVIRVIEQEPNGWWSGDLNGKLGYMPYTYLEVIEGPPRGRGMSYFRQSPPPKPASSAGRGGGGATNNAGRGGAGRGRT